MIVPHRRGHASNGRSSHSSSRGGRGGYGYDGSSSDSRRQDVKRRSYDDRDADRRRGYSSDEDRSASYSSSSRRGQYRRDDRDANYESSRRGGHGSTSGMRSSSSSSGGGHRGGYRRQYADSSASEDDDADAVRQSSYSPEERKAYSPEHQHQYKTRSTSREYDDRDRRSDRENHRPRNHATRSQQKGAAGDGDGDDLDASYYKSTGNSNIRRARKQSDSGVDDYSSDSYRPKRSNNRSCSPPVDNDQQQYPITPPEPMQEHKPRSRARKERKESSSSSRSTRREVASTKPPRSRTIANTTTSSSTDGSTAVAVSKSSSSSSQKRRLSSEGVHPSGRPERTSDSGLDDDLVAAAAAATVTAAPSSGLAAASTLLSTSQLSLTLSLAESDGQPPASSSSSSSFAGATTESAVAAAAAAPVTYGKYGLMSNETFFANFADVDVDTLVSSACPPQELALASIVRSGTSKRKVNYFTMSMETETKEGNREVLYARRQRHGKAISYVISTEDLRVLDGGEATFIGKLKANVKKDKFVIYDGGNKKKKERKEVGTLIYTAKSWSTPRGLMARVDGGAGRDMTFVNALPEWDPVAKVHSLKFNGRATEVSVKNFKLVKDGVHSQIAGGVDQMMYLRMGKVGKHTFNIDFRAPFSPLQAFAIALSSFES